jgi:hypothetical protein
LDHLSAAVFSASIVFARGRIFGGVLTTTNLKEF